MTTSRITILPDDLELTWTAGSTGAPQPKHGKLNHHKVCHILYVDNQWDSTLVKGVLCNFLTLFIKMGLLLAEVVQESRKEHTTYWRQEGDVWVKEIVDYSLCTGQQVPSTPRRRITNLPQDFDYEIPNYHQQLTSLAIKIILCIFFLIGVKVLQRIFS